MSAQFAGKVAVVTGAGSGVGRASALLLAREGATVALLGRRAEPLQAVASEIQRDGGVATWEPVDVSVDSQITAAVRRVAADHGHVDLLVNAAGILRMGDVTQVSEADWDAVFAVNAKGCFLASRAVIPLMCPVGGAIVNVTSVFALASSKGAAIYAASKAAVVALTQAMALDHIDAGIRVNCVAPGSMATPMLQTVAQAAAPDNPQRVLDLVARLHPSGRLVDVDAVAKLIAYLLSDDASPIVGATFVIDGGRLAKLGAADS